MLKQSIRAIGAGLATFLSGLLIYEAPPESVAQFVMWAWQPALQGVLVTLGAFGLNVATRGRFEGGGV